MKPDNITIKLIIIALIGGACLIASLMVFGLVEEREHRFSEAKQDIASMWGSRQELVGPMLIWNRVRTDLPSATETVYLLPETLDVRTELVPEIRSRGIFDAVVYTGKMSVSGTFSAKEIERLRVGSQAVFSVGLTDTRGVQSQVRLLWDASTYPFNPSAKNPLVSASGVYAEVPVHRGIAAIPFSFELSFKGSEGITVVPVGTDTRIFVASSWPTPKFIGAFLPVERDLSNTGFTGGWNISSFGQTFPHTGTDRETGPSQFSASAAGVELLQQVDLYDQVSRSVKYAVLFILITFAAFFIFEVLSGLRVHPVQYLLIGGSLALFYLLLLSFSEQIGFLPSYILSAALTALLITAYSARVLQSRRRAYPISALLVVLYGYLYFVLQLEDYALLFGSLLLFALLATVMYLTRNVNWFEPAPKNTS